MDALKMSDVFAVATGLKSKSGDELPMTGEFGWEVEQPDGTITKGKFHNTVMTAGKNKLWDVMFRNQTQIATWYFGLINNSGTPTISAADTLASHAWTESTDYDEVARQAWVPTAAASGSMTNVTLAEFNIDTTVTIYGAFICSASTGTSGTLWSAGAFGTGPAALTNGSIVRLTYTVSA